MPCYVLERPCGPQYTRYIRPYELIGGSPYNNLGSRRSSHQENVNGRRPDLHLSATSRPADHARGFQARGVGSEPFHSDADARGSGGGGGGLQADRAGSGRRVRLPEEATPHPVGELLVRRPGGLEPGGDAGRAGPHRLTRYESGRFSSVFHSVSPLATPTGRIFKTIRPRASMSTAYSGLSRSRTT